MNIYGYARVSTKEQNLARQLKDFEHKIEPFLPLLRLFLKLHLKKKKKALENYRPYDTMT